MGWHYYCYCSEYLNSLACRALKVFKNVCKSMEKKRFVQFVDGTQFMHIFVMLLSLGSFAIAADAASQCPSHLDVASFFSSSMFHNNIQL